MSFSSLIQWKCVRTCLFGATTNFFTCLDTSFDFWSCRGVWGTISCVTYELYGWGHKGPPSLKILFQWYSGKDDRRRRNSACTSGQFSRTAKITHEKLYFRISIFRKWVQIARRKQDVSCITGTVRHCGLPQGQVQRVASYRDHSGA